MIIGLSGKRGVGKTLAADYLVENHNFKKVSFANKLKEISDSFFPGLSKSEKEKPFREHSFTPREFMIHLGQFMRFHDPEYWVKSSNISAMRGNVVIDDVRFRNEADYLKELGAKLVRINRFEKLNVYGKDLDDPSETDLDNYKGFDFIVEDCVNVKPIDLYKQLNNAMKQFKEKE